MSDKIFKKNKLTAIEREIVDIMNNNDIINEEFVYKVYIIHYDKFIKSKIDTLIKEYLNTEYYVDGEFNLFEALSLITAIESNIVRLSLEVVSSSIKKIVCAAVNRALETRNANESSLRFFDKSKINRLGYTNAFLYFRYMADYFVYEKLNDTMSELLEDFDNKLYKYYKESDLKKVISYSQMKTKKGLSLDSAAFAKDLSRRCTRVISLLLAKDYVYTYDYICNKYFSDNEELIEDSVMEEYIEDITSTKTRYEYVGNWKELSSIASNKGFNLIRCNGDHGIFFNTLTNKTVVIPQGRNIGKGLSISIQKQLDEVNEELQP